MQYVLGIHPGADVRNAVIWELTCKTAKHAHSSQTERIVSPLPNLQLEHHPNWRFYPLELNPGQYYPRIARPSNDDLKDAVGFNPQLLSLLDVLESNNSQLVALKEQLERIWRVVQPHPSTMNAFGHEIRNLLILACTEVEAHWKGILGANAAAANNTHDYVKLVEPLQLDAYKVQFPHYPWISQLQPFKGWRPSRSPTKDLGWYDAYNAVKHDREGNFPNATLHNAMNAVCACFVMQCAQFGTPRRWCRDELRPFFMLSKGPNWSPSAVYSSPPEGKPYVQTNYPF